MFKKMIAALVVGMFAVAGHAAQVTDSDLAAASKLASATQLKERVEAIRLQAAVSNEKQMNQVVDQLKKSLPGITETQLSALRSAAQTLITKVTSSWDGEQAAKIYTTSLVSTMTAEQVQAASEFYASVNGKKALAGISTAEQKMATYITTSQEQAMAAGYVGFMDEMKLIIATKPK